VAAERNADTLKITSLRSRAAGSLGLTNQEVF
jgi:hypothetical protein